MSRTDLNEKPQRDELRRFVGHYCYGIYPMGAITCCHNGRMIRLEGKAERLAKDGLGRLGVVIDGSVFHPAEIKCPSLHWVGDAYKARTE